MSFFGGSSKKTSKKKTESKEEPEETGPAFNRIGTGGEVDEVVSRLLHHAYDKDEAVRMAISASLTKVGEKQPALVMTSIASFVSKRGKKLTHNHRVQCLKILCGVLEISRTVIDSDVAKTLCAFGARELVASKEVKSDWQTPASQILVILSMSFPDIAIDEVLNRFKPGVIPHYYVVKTLADMAAANGVAFTLRLKDVLARVIPVLGAVRSEPLKWVFAAAMGRFAECIGHFRANASEEEKMQVADDAFETDMSSAFAILFSKWLVMTKEAKVRLAVVESMGYMAPRLSKSDLEAKLAELIPQYLAMLKKEKFSSSLPITQGLCAVLEAAVENDSQQLEFVLPQVLQGIHPMVAIPLDFKHPTTVKNHNELLRIFEILARSRQDTVLTFITNRFPLKEETPIIASLIILKHLVNAMDSELGGQKSFILNSVSSLVTENSLALRKHMLQLIVGMANQGYLSLSGGQTLVRYLVKQAAILDKKVKQFDSAKKGKSVDVSPGQLRSAATRILHVMTTKVTDTHTVLWPFLLEVVSHKDYQDAIVVVLRCIGDLLSMKAEAKEEVSINFDANPDLPSPQVIMARLMVLVNFPHKRKGLGPAVIDAMETLGHIIHSNVGGYWDEAVPALRDHLEAHTEEDLNLAKWQDTLLKVFRETINAVGPGGWLRTLADALSEQYKLYPDDDQARRIIHRYLGALLASITARELISSKIDLLLAITDHKSDVQRHGCAQGLGLTASKHIDVVLPKLTAKLEALKPKQKGFFSFGKSESEKGADEVRSTVVLAYGYSTAYADTSSMTSRLEAHVLNNILPIMIKQSRKMVVKENVIKAVDLIGKAMHESRLPAESKFVMKQRDKLIEGLLVFLGAKKKSADGKKGADGPVQVPSNQLRVLGLNALSTLCNLQPPVSSKCRKEILDTVLPFYGLGHEDEKKSSGDGEDVISLVHVNLNQLLSSIIFMDCNIGTLTSLLKRLEPYLVSKKQFERERACTSYLVILKKFISERQKQSEKELKALGAFVATLLPRCTDPSLSIRQTAVESVQALLYVDQLLKNPDNPTPSQQLKLLTEIRDQMDCDGIDEVLAVARDLGSILSALVDPSEFVGLVQTLVDGLNDPVVDSGVGAATLLHVLISKRGVELLPGLNEWVNALIPILRKISEPVQQVALTAFVALGATHFQPVLDVLYGQTLPLNDEVISCFKALAESKLAEDLLSNLLKVINDSPMLEEKDTPKVMVATSALSNIVGITNISKLLRSRDNYASTLCTLLLRLGTAAGIGDGTGTSDTIDGLTNFMQQNDEKMHEALAAADAYTELKGATCDESVAKFAGVLFTARSDLELKSLICQFLSNYLSQRCYPGQRTVATSVLAECVLHSKDEDDHLAQLIKYLLPRVADPMTLIRKQALRGMGNLEPVWSDQVAMQAPSILSALTSGSEDKEAVVAAEAVSSLTKVSRVVSENTMVSMLINICYRMRPAFDRSEKDIRRAAFNLFCALTRFGHHQGIQFMDQVHDNMVIFIVHCNDEDEDVREACLAAFKQSAALAGGKLNELLQETDSVESYSYDEFSSDLAPILVEMFPERINNYLDSCSNYYKSKWSEIRANAAMMTCTLLAATTVIVRERLNTNSIVNAVLELLKESSAKVRSKAAKGLSLLHDI